MREIKLRANVAYHMHDILRWTSILVGLSMFAGTLLSLSRSPHWFVRGWDFPRLQIAVLASGAGALYSWCCSEGALHDKLFLGSVMACVIWQAARIYPYTPIAPVRVQRSRDQSDERRLRLLICNVQMENTAHERLLRLVRETNPDVLLAVETDERWVRALEPLAAEYPHVLRQPQSNWFGMVLFSRLPLHEARVQFLVQDDIPSVFAMLELAGDRVLLCGLHPRPPEPLRNQDSSPRDAELVLVGRWIAKQNGAPAIVAGDLNDVAWSATTQLFLRLSKLLDPRMGRGLYNTYNARNPLVRWPLDHLFHSNHFRLVELRRCGDIGSDHFPVLVELSYEPEAAAEQSETRAAPGDAEEAEERLDAQADAARTGDDRPDRS
ncbi:MAG TPA: endonuclease/exonuclease/phosphatase family protein [Gemmatimonadales bacterium]|nr:endonuclease/exonuclease/phosphatase family protein [Gemmatimonadales bacterium]